MEIDKAFTRFIKEYQEINGSHVHTYSNPPTPLEFLRHSVHPNRPAVIKNAFHHWPACTKWTNAYLRDTMGDTPVTVASTPNGYADAVTMDEVTQQKYFALPHEQRMPFSDYLDLIEGKAISENAHYISLQNGSLPTEFSLLENDVDPEITWCSEALGKSPDAVNFWFGNEKSITSLHKDPYENCYAVVRGSKTFILFPPSEYYCMHESLYPNAIYVPDEKTGKLTLQPLDPPSKTPWIPVDPQRPDLEQYPRFAHARPIVVTIGEGEMLYLPALWFHQVLQKGDDGVIAINYWYDMEYTNTLFPVTGLFRGLVMGALDGQSNVLDDDRISISDDDENEL
ncbi:cupin-like domain-containing protein [Radiomyces spectabilis]|uniref:cupin-like domain-containing protein n=1 Tax=Radiomyces spectabilis TaxID=64574 RepID=UPI002220EFFA|nr:cupin-like domain-containing protein [Radiomyces spectabilis]KAI8378028.1 cupin-like domain-containing protein [Radiomyces spectabilis]